MLTTVFTFAAGIAVSSFVGYFVHRSLHKEWTGPLFNGHREHHHDMYPPGDLVSKEYRAAKWYNQGVVLFAPAAVVLIGGIGFASWMLGVSMWTFGTFTAGLLAYGLLNDKVHDAFHLEEHWLHRYPNFKAHQDLHFKHHVDTTTNFGIADTLWDRVFKTSAP